MTASPHVLAIFQNIGMTEMIVIGIVALLIFGRRLPEVGRSLGRGIVEFKKGLRDTGEELNQIGSDVRKDVESKAPTQSAEQQKSSA
jgi:sec-independent protein translocase protein TatA